MYWAILYGVIAAVALLIFKMLADYLTYLWFPVFLLGMVWGGYRKYTQDKKAWMAGTGIVGTSKSAIEEFKDAARDIANASREMMAKRAQEDSQSAIGIQEEAIAAQQETIAPEAEAAETPVAPEAPAIAAQEEPEEIVTQETVAEDEQRPPQSPTQPLV